MTIATKVTMVTQFDLPDVIPMYTRESGERRERERARESVEQVMKLRAISRYRDDFLRENSYRRNYSTIINVLLVFCARGNRRGNAHLSGTKIEEIW